MKRLITNVVEGFIARQTWRSARCLPAILVSVMAATHAIAQIPTPQAFANTALPLYTNGSVDAIAQASDGTLYVGGLFTSVNGVAANNLARVSAAGITDATWNPNPTDNVTTVAVDADGTVYIGGAFQYVDGIRQVGVSKILPNGAVDQNWTPTISSAFGVIINIFL